MKSPNWYASLPEMSLPAFSSPDLASFRIFFVKSPNTVMAPQEQPRPCAVPCNHNSAGRRKQVRKVSFNLPNKQRKQSKGF